MLVIGSIGRFCSRAFSLGDSIRQLAQRPLAIRILIHSTLLLGGCWVHFAVSRQSNHALAERLWKFAAVAGFVTTAIQLAASGSMGKRSLLRPRHQVLQQEFSKEWNQ